jgi:hypothetical protein
MLKKQINTEKKKKREAAIHMERLPFMAPAWEGECGYILMESYGKWLLLREIMLSQNLLSAIKYGGILNMNNTSIWTWFQVEFHHFSVLVLMSSEIIPDCLFFNVQLLRNSGYAAMRKRMLNTAQLFECDIHMQNV